jgi:MFS family permease
MTPFAALTSRAPAREPRQPDLASSRPAPRVMLGLDADRSGSRSRGAYSCGAPRGPRDGRGGVIRRTIAAIRTLGANQPIVRVVVAYGGFTIGEWATWIAMLVYAFDRGGAAAAGIVALVQLAPSAVLGPVLSGIGDRVPRERLLIASYLLQAVAMATVAAALVADAPVPLVYGLAALSTLAVALTRPAHGSILPSLARTPEELTSANVASGTMQTLGILVAPALAGILLLDAGPAAVFVVSAVVCALSGALAAGVRTERTTVERPGAAPSEPGDPAAGEPGAVAVESATVGVIEGLRILVGHPGSRTIVLIIAAGSVIEGALDLIAVVLALDLLAMGDGGVGLLGSAVGAGGLIGAASAALLIGRSRLALPLVAGLLLWSVPLAIIGLLPNAAVAVGLLVLAGVGRSLMDIAGRTMLQRVAPEHALGGIFGALEGLHDAMLAVGSVAVPILIALIGVRPALIVTGLWLPIVVALSWNSLRAADDHSVVHVRELRLLRAMPMFAALAPPTIERLSANLGTRRATAGELIIRQGDRGDRFYLIDSGVAEVELDGRVVRVLEPGAGFGEIALVRNVPRTASVRAIEPVTLFSLDRSTFLQAVTGHAEARSATDRIVRDRLDADATDASR